MIKFILIITSLLAVILFMIRSIMKNRINEKMLHMDKLASIGTMATGVAHEIATPLTVIKAYLSLESIKHSIPKDVHSELMKAADRITEISRSLRSFARVSGPHNNKIDIHSAITDSVSLLTEIYKSNGVKITINNNAENPYVWGNLGYVQQILVNLISNSKDAKAKHILIQTDDDKDGVKVIVFDDGHGIPKNVINKIFDPFFTTKPQGEGTGIGLSIVKTLVESMSCKIHVESSSHGTVFTLLFNRDHCDN